MISFPQAVAVVARREIRERLRDRAFYLSLGVSLLIVAAVVILPQVFGGGGDPKATVVAGDQAGLRLARAAQQGDDRFSVRIVPARAAGDADAERRLHGGRADVGILASGTRLVVARDAEDGAVAAVQAASAQARAIAALGRRGITPAEAGRALAPPALPSRRVGENDDAARGVAYLALIVLFGQIIGLGAWLAAGVVEEKSSRIVEIILSAVSSRAILAGKILGMGVVGLLQVLIIGVTGVALAVATGNVDVGGSGVVGALFIVLGWFVLGYALYACLFAAAGSLVSRSEDIQSATTPVTIVLFAGFFLSFTALDDPESTLATVLSILPPTAPLTMPVRMITGAASAGEVLLAVALTLAAAAALVVLAARIYANAVLRTGGRVKLAAALRGEQAL